MWSAQAPPITRPLTSKLQALAVSNTPSLSVRSKRQAITWATKLAPRDHLVRCHVRTSSPRATTIREFNFDLDPAKQSHKSTIYTIRLLPRLPGSSFYLSKFRNMATVSVDRLSPFSLPLLLRSSFVSFAQAQRHPNATNLENSLEFIFDV